MQPYSQLTIIGHPTYLAHDTGGGEHPEDPERLRVIDKQIRKSPLAPFIRSQTAQMADRENLLGYHEKSYLFRLEEAVLSGKTYIDHVDNQIGFESYQAMLLAASGCLTGIDLLEKEETKLVFCAIRPPGHHAERRTPLGFCFLNNAVIAGSYWQRKYSHEKIAIIDWDAHHGNGIQDAFEDDASVFYVSIHEHPSFSFPGTGYADEDGMGKGKGTTLNIPLPPGADDTMLLNALDTSVIPALDSFSPDRIIVCAGFDGHIQDDMSGLSYSTALYGHIGARMTALARRHCQGKLLSILEGGYHLKALAESVEQYLIHIAKS